MVSKFSENKVINEKGTKILKFQMELLSKKSKSDLQNMKIISDIFCRSDHKNGDQNNHSISISCVPSLNNSINKLSPKSKRKENSLKNSLKFLNTNVMF